MKTPNSPQKKTLATTGTQYNVVVWSEWTDPPTPLYYNSPQKKTLVSAWPSVLDPTGLKDVRGLAADGSSQTQSLLNMNVSLCWAVVVL